jgi:hypothetical protein
MFCRSAFFNRFGGTYEPVPRILIDGTFKHPPIKTMMSVQFTSVEVVSKPQIRFKGKAQADRESAAYVQYVSIYQRPATQPLGFRWGFETTSNQI